MKLFSCIGIILFLQSCSSLTLKPAGFGWPVESVLKVDDNGFVNEPRYVISFNTIPIFLEETEDSTAYQNKEIRIIRDTKGFYFITSDNFKNVYVFSADDGELCLENKILISETGINNPALNQRSPYIELVEGGRKHLLNADGLINEETNED